MLGQIDSRATELTAPIAVDADDKRMRQQLFVGALLIGLAAAAVGTSPVV